MYEKPYKQYYYRWIDHIKYDDFEKDRQIILRDLVGKSHNSLFI
jgi:hypothetical protein